jgi:hypothetical protein
MVVERHSQIAVRLEEEDGRDGFEPVRSRESASRFVPVPLSSRFPP